MNSNTIFVSSKSSVPDRSVLKPTQRHLCGYDVCVSTLYNTCACIEVDGGGTGAGTSPNQLMVLTRGFASNDSTAEKVPMVFEDRVTNRADHKIFD